MKQIKQMREADWYDLFIFHPASMEQARIAINRQKEGLSLASYEVAAIEAYKLVQSQNITKEKGPPLLEALV